MAEGQEPNANPEGGQEPTPDPQPSGGQEPQGGKGGDTPDPSKPETFSREYVENLRKEAAANRKAAKDAQDKIDELADRDKSEADKAKARADRAEARASKAEADLLRHSVAASKKVPADAVDLLQGSTQDELEASADKLLGLIKASGGGDKPADFDAGARPPAPAQKSPEQAHNDLLVGMLTGTQPQTPGGQGGGTPFPVPPGAEPAPADD